jgi:hypothetical protein
LRELVITVIVPTPVGREALGRGQNEHRPITRQFCIPQSTLVLYNLPSRHEQPLQPSLHAQLVPLA